MEEMRIGCLADVTSGDDAEAIRLIFRLKHLLGYYYWIAGR